MAKPESWARKAEPRCEATVSPGYARIRWFAPPDQWKGIMRSFQTSLGPQATLVRQGPFAAFQLPLAVQPQLGAWLDKTFGPNVMCDQEELARAVADWGVRYADYLQSAAWEAKRQKVIDRERRAQGRDPPFCQGAGSGWAASDR